MSRGLLEAYQRTTGARSTNSLSVWQKTLKPDCYQPISIRREMTEIDVYLFLCIKYPRKVMELNLRLCGVLSDQRIDGLVLRREFFPFFVEEIKVVQIRSTEIGHGLQDSNKPVTISTSHRISADPVVDQQPSNIIRAFRILEARVRRVEHPTVEAIPNPFDKAKRRLQDHPW